MIKVNHPWIIIKKKNRSQTDYSDFDTLACQIETDFVDLTLKIPFKIFDLKHFETDLFQFSRSTRFSIYHVHRYYKSLWFITEEEKKYIYFC